LRRRQRKVTSGWKPDCLEGKSAAEDINISLSEHVSPIEWEKVILYGQYVLNPDDIG
jgi:hypothetical protein